MTRIEVETTLEPVPTTWVTVRGSLHDRGAVTALHEAVGLLPLGATIVVHIDPTGLLESTGAEALAELSRHIAADHGRLIIVTGDVDQRASMVLAEVDQWATLLHSTEQVTQLLGHAA
jgi:hypothetical protein